MVNLFCRLGSRCFLVSSILLENNLLCVGCRALYGEDASLVDVYFVHQHNTLSGVVYHATMINAVAVAVGHCEHHVVACAHNLAALAYVLLQHRIVFSLREGAERIVGSGITYGIVLSAIVVCAIHYIICVALAEQIAALRPAAVHLAMRRTAALPFALAVRQFRRRAK